MQRELSERAYKEDGGDVKKKCITRIIISYFTQIQVLYLLCSTKKGAFLNIKKNMWNK